MRKDTENLIDEEFIIQLLDNDEPMKVYIPATIALLEKFVAQESYTPVSLLAFGITSHLKEQYTYDEEEELEHIAFLAATDASLRLLAEELLVADNADIVMRRVVIAARVAEAKERYDLDDCAYELSSEITLAQVEAVYVDAKAAEPLVARAATLIDEADLGSEKAQFIIEDIHDELLEWYSVQEVPFLLDLIDL